MQIDAIHNRWRYANDEYKTASSENVNTKAILIFFPTPPGALIYDTIKFTLINNIFFVFRFFEINEAFYFTFVCTHRERELRESMKL